MIVKEIKTLGELMEALNDKSIKDLELKPSIKLIKPDQSEIIDETKKHHRGQPQWAKDMENRILTYVDVHINDVVSRLDNFEKKVDDVIKINHLKTK